MTLPIERVEALKMAECIIHLNWDAEIFKHGANDFDARQKSFSNLLGYIADTIEPLLIEINKINKACENIAIGGMDITKRADKKIAELEAQVKELKSNLAESYDLQNGLNGKIKSLESKVGKWFKRPEYKDFNGLCSACAGKPVLIRGKHPKEDYRAVCPTCAIETLEYLYDQCNNRECSSVDEAKEGA